MACPFVVRGGYVRFDTAKRLCKPVYVALWNWLGEGSAAEEQQSLFLIQAIIPCFGMIIASRGYYVGSGLLKASKGLDSS